MKKLWRGARSLQCLALLASAVAEEDVGLQFARTCIGANGFPTQWEYPSDAEAHFDALHRSFEQLLRRNPPGNRVYLGVEDTLWERATFEDLPLSQNGTRALRDVYGPYIPLFFKWTLLHRGRHEGGGNGNRYPPEFLAFLRRELRPNVLYITVVQSDRGIAGFCEISHEEFPNILTLSAGGYGHVPIPLFPKRPRKGDSVPAGLAPMAQRKYLTSYVGSIGHAPHAMRQRMVALVESTATELGFLAVPQYKGPAWRHVMVDSRTCLAPRGFGRTSYHLIECIQAGLIPIQVYTDVPWVPYQSLFERDIGFVVQVDQVPALLHDLHRMPTQELDAKEESVRRHSFLFDEEHVALQISKLMLGQPHDLSCTPLPATIRDASDCGAL